jgi:hypothetical protein
MRPYIRRSGPKPTRRTTGHDIHIQSSGEELELELTLDGIMPISVREGAPSHQQATGLRLHQQVAGSRGASEARKAEWNTGISDPDERLHYT